MKKTVTLSAILMMATFSLWAQAQLILEHTFEDCRSSARQMIPGLGEVYTCYDAEKNLLNLYGGDYGFIKSIPLPAREIPISDVRSLFLRLFSTDTEGGGELRVIFGYTGSGLAGHYLLNEEGEVLIASDRLISLDSPRGLQPLVETLSETKTFYLGLQELDTLASFDTQQVRRFAVEGIGDVFVYVDAEGVLRALDFNGQLLAEIELGASGPDKIWFITPYRNVFTQDGRLEFMYTFQDFSGEISSKAGIINEDGEELLALPNFNSIRLSEIPGQPTKLITGRAWSQYRVYSVPELEFEKIYNDVYQFQRFASSTAGALYSYRSEAQVVIYDSGHQLLASTNIPGTTFEQFVALQEVSQNNLLADDKIEILTLIYAGPFSQEGTGDCLLQNADGEIIFFDSNVREFRASQPPGLTSKILVEFDNRTGVYADPTLVGIRAALTNTFSLKVFPNPAGEEALVQWEETRVSGPLNLRLLDSRGREVWQQQTKEGAGQQAVDLSGLPAGLYFLRADKGGKLWRSKKLLKY